MIGDLEKPLGQFFALNQRARAPPAPCLNLLVGKHGHIHRVPVDDGVLAIHEALFEKVDEHRLLLAVVFRIAGGKFARPVNRQAQRLHLRAHLGNVVVGPSLGMAAGGHCGILGGHPERIPAHRVQDAETTGRLIARDHIPHGVVAHMSHMDAPRRIGEHLQHVVFLLGGIRRGGKDTGCVPRSLPLRFDLGRGQSGHGRVSLGWIGNAIRAEGQSGPQAFLMRCRGVVQHHRRIRTGKMGARYITAVATRASACTCRPRLQAAVGNAQLTGPCENRILNRALGFSRDRAAATRQRNAQGPGFKRGILHIDRGTI